MAASDLTILTNVKAWQSPPLASTADDALLTRLVTAASQFILGYLQRPMLSSQLYAEARDGEGGASLMLRQWPATSIASLVVDGMSVGPASGGTSLVPGYLLDPWDGWSAGQPQRLALAGYRFVRGIQNIFVSYWAGYLVAAEPQMVPPSPGPYMVTTSRFRAADSGVSYAAGGALAPVAANPTRGQYVPPSGLGGAYTFAAGDAGAAVAISYSYIPDDIQQACIELVSLRYAERNRIGQASKSLAGEVVAFTQKDMPADVATALQPYRRVFTP